VVATLATALTGWADSTARISTADSDFSAEDIVRQPAVVVLACPGRQRAIYAPYLGAVLRKLMLDLDTIGERNRGPLPMPVGVILDEFPTLGKLDSLVADVNLVRKRRISIMIAAQTKGQFHMIYGPDATNALFAGMATQIIFGGADQETADFYSRASGQATELTEEGGFKLLAGPEEEIQKQQKAQKRQRQLLTSDEIQTPARGNATIFTRYVTESYATQLIFWAKLTRMYQREDWKRMMEGLSEEDAFCLQRPLSFAPAPSIEKAASPQPGK
jgi:type IV secretion system protein VirD4